MSYNFNNEIPIYLQIVDFITKEITSGLLIPGKKIPSVREYAVIFKANPNTISKALQILEDKKLIYTERTNGKFVTKDLNIIKLNKDEISYQKTVEYVNDLKSMGYTIDEIINKIRGIK